MIHKPWRQTSAKVLRIVSGPLKRHQREPQATINKAKTPAITQAIARKTNKHTTNCKNNRQARERSQRRPRNPKQESASSCACACSSSHGKSPTSLRKKKSRKASTQSRIVFSDVVCCVVVFALSFTFSPLAHSGRNVVVLSFCPIPWPFQLHCKNSFAAARATSAKRRA